MPPPFEKCGGAKRTPPFLHLCVLSQHQEGSRDLHCQRSCMHGYSRLERYGIDYKRCMYTRLHGRLWDLMVGHKRYRRIISRLQVVSDITVSSTSG